MPKPTIINVVSGKGGTGKTLLTAVLADLLGNASYKVVVIDLDIFVRGLTALLYYHMHEKLRLIESDELSVAEFFITKGDRDRSGKSKLAIRRYRSFDVVPSVGTVDEVLRFDDLMPDSKAEASRLVGKLLDMLPDEYDIVLLDSRAGYDELISASHRYADFSICVEEEDPISKITSDNLLLQLQEDSDEPVFRLVNKTRNVEDEFELEMPGLTSIGRVPFDIEVMNSFGTKFFWEDISRTLYKSALAAAWNRVSNKMGLNKAVDQFRPSPVGSAALEARLQFYSLRDRVLIVYGVLIGVLGISYSLFGPKGLASFFRNVLVDPSFLSLFAGIFGIGMALYGMFRKKR